MERHGASCSETSVKVYAVQVFDQWDYHSKFGPPYAQM